MRNLYHLLIFCLFYIILQSENVHAQVSNMTITLNATGACASATTFKKGSSCVFEMVIQVPINTPTMMHVELFTSDNSTTTMAQICRPTITIGTNYNLTNVPIPELSSSNGNYQVLLIFQLFYKDLIFQCKFSLIKQLLILEL